MLVCMSVHGSEDIVTVQHFPVFPIDSYHPLIKKTVIHE